METLDGKWAGGEIVINSKYKKNRNAIASELVHEATHALNEDDFPASKTKLTIDEEMRTNTNQLDLYQEQRKSGYRDPELERRRKARKDGTLRDDVRGRYPGSAESLSNGRARNPLPALQITTRVNVHFFSQSVTGIWQYRLLDSRRISNESPR